LIAFTRYEYVVPADSPVLAYVLVFAARVASGEYAVHVLVPVQRSTTKPVSLLELSAQARLIWLVDPAAAVSPDGAAGAELPVPVPLANVVALAVLEYADVPAALKARTR
jgi:hypothetical protein